MKIARLLSTSTRKAGHTPRLPPPTRDVAAALLERGASPTPVVLKVSVQNRRTTLPPEGPLALATRRFPPDGGLLGGLLRDAASV